MNLLSLLYFVSGNKGPTILERVVTELRRNRQFVLLDCPASLEQRNAIDALIDATPNLPEKGLFSKQSLKEQWTVASDVSSVLMKKWADEAAKADAAKRPRPDMPIASATLLAKWANEVMVAEMLAEQPREIKTDEDKKNEAMLQAELAKKMDIKLLLPLFRWDIPIYYDPHELYSLLLIKAGHVPAQFLTEPWNRQVWRPYVRGVTTISSGDLVTVPYAASKNQSHVFLQMPDRAFLDLNTSLEFRSREEIEPFVSHVLPLWSVACTALEPLLKTLTTKRDTKAGGLFFSPDQFTSRNSVGSEELEVQPVTKKLLNRIKKTNPTRGLPQWLLSSQPNVPDILPYLSSRQWTFLSQAEAMAVVLLHTKLITKKMAIGFMKKNKPPTAYGLNWSDEKGGIELKSTKHALVVCNPGDLVIYGVGTTNPQRLGLVLGKTSLFMWSAFDPLIKDISTLFQGIEGERSKCLPAQYARQQFEAMEFTK